jgi:arabinofuranosyltransferase
MQNATLTDRTALRLVTLAAAALALYQYFTLFPFAIDDAYIVLRYARNLVTTGDLVFNPGERVSALTSPLHALLTAVLYALTGEKALTAYKIVCCGCIGAGIWAVIRTHRDFIGALPIALTLLLVSPSVVLWTFGGLETPLLFGVVAAFAALLQSKLRASAVLDRRTLVALHLLSAAAFLIRHDSVCFFAPALLVCWLHRDGWKSVGIAVVIAALPCIAWFGFALGYFGDLLPTSFYVKTPRYRPREIAVSALYELTWLTLLGVVPCLVAALARRWMARDWHVENSEWILLAGLMGIFVYGLGMAQKHMMFGFRHGVPYLPALACVVIIEFRRWSWRGGALAALLVAVLGLHVLNMQRMLDVSVNGYWRWSAYSEAGARSLIQMIDVWKGTARDIDAHWKTHASADRAPRVFTYAGGVVPYELPGAYIFEELISARRNRCARPQDIELAADYIHTVRTPQTVVSPYYNAIVSNPGLQLISDREIRVGEELRRVQAYYNATPRPLALPARFNEPCVSQAR